MAIEGIIDKVIIVTKTHQRTREDERCESRLKQSLRKLRTNRIDIVFLHSIGDEKTLKQAMKTEGSLKPLREARTQGKIDFIGISGHRPQILTNAMKTPSLTLFLCH